MSTFELKVTAFGGVGIEAACREAVELATKLRLIVGFDFNGVHCMARPDGDAAELERLWGESLKSEHTYKVVSA